MANVTSAADYWLQREKEHRDRALSASDTAVRDAHLGLAERYADQAWITAENDISAKAIPSSLWKRAPDHA